MAYYTFVGQNGGKIYHRFVDNGIRKSEVINKYNFELYHRDDFGEYIALDGNRVTKVTFDSVFELYSYTSKNDKSMIYGNTSPIQQFIVNEYPDDIVIDSNAYVTLCYDLEVKHDDGFPDPVLAIEPILSVSYELVKDGDVISYVIGCKEYDSEYYAEYLKEDGEFPLNIVYYECETEVDLIKKFIDEWSKINPDFVTGWNIEGFDNPYFINRCKRVLPDIEYLNRLSPFGNKMSKGAIDFNNSTVFGVTSIDYLDLYKKYSLTKHESYKLGFIATHELGDGKVSFEEYNNNLMNLYRGKYKIKPTADVDKLHQKDKWCMLRTIVADEIQKRGLNDNDDA